MTENSKYDANWVLMKFLVDAMLGKLAKELRMLGYDTLYYRGKDLHELIQLARQQERVILTRNTRLTPETTENPIIQVTEDDPAASTQRTPPQGIIALNERNSFFQVSSLQCASGRNHTGGSRGKSPGLISTSIKRRFIDALSAISLYWPGTHQERMKKRLEEFI